MADHKRFSLENMSSFVPESGVDKCYHCLLAFGEGETKVIFKNGQWHKRCFVCSQCLEELEVEMVFQNEGMMYCVHDYKMLFAPSCHQCNQFILEGRVIKALDHCWHSLCFVCYSCKEPLADSHTFKKFENHAFCQDCYNNIKSQYDGMYICQKCKGGVECNGYLKFEGDLYHPYHFKCKTCQNELDKNFREKEGNYFCIRCFDKMGIPICTACKRPVEERVVYALGKAYHVEHFVCSFCNKPFLGTRYFLYNKDVYCEIHYQMMATKLCSYCNKDVGQDSVEFLAKIYCLDHFRCFACDSLLNKSSKIFKVDRKPICKPCLLKLPSHLRKRLADLHKKDV